MRLETLVNEMYDRLNANDREIVNRIFCEKQQVREMNSTEISRFLHISRTTFVRFMKKLGIGTYAEFKLLLAPEEMEHSDIQFDMKEIVRNYHVMIDELKKHNYTKICTMIRKAGTIYLYGSGNEQKAVAEEFKRIFLIFGKCCVELFDLGEVEFARRRFSRDDVFLAISLSGEGAGILKALRCVQGSEIQTVSLTRWANNTLAGMCQENLYVGTKTVSQGDSPSYEMVAAFYILLDILSVRYLEQLSEKTEGISGAGTKGTEKKTEKNGTEDNIAESGRRYDSEHIGKLLNRYYDSFNENEKYICHYLTAHYKECLNDTISEFARQCGVSQTFMVRFAKKIGLSGYGELKAVLKLELSQEKQISQGLMEQVTESYHKMMDDLMRKDMSALFRKLTDARRVFVFGSGSSQARAASEMKRIFLPLKELIYIHGHDMSRALQKTAEPEDMVILISLSGESESVVRLAEELRIKGVPSVSVTRMRNNTLGSLCEDNLYINSICMLVGNSVRYEISTPYFILIEYLYLSYQIYLTRCTT